MKKSEPKEIINPPGLAKPSGYSHAIRTRGGSLIFLAGQVGWNSEKQFVSAAMTDQFEQALQNLKTVAEQAGAQLTDIVKLTLYVTDRRAYLDARKPIGVIYRKYFGKYFPAMTLVEVKGLAEEAAKIEIEGIAVCPTRRGND